MFTQDMQFAATPPFTGGTLARYFALPADIAHHIPDSMSFEDGALIEPLAVGVHSVSTLANVRPGQVHTYHSFILFSLINLVLSCN